MKGPAFATVTLDAGGGGVAAVSRLIWSVFRDEWGAGARLVTLAAREGDRAADAGERVTFGARMAAAQLGGGCSWVLYGHVAVAQVQRYVPASFRRPYAVFLHGIEAWRPLDRARRKAIEGAALLISNSAYTARRITEAHPWVPRIEACPLALPPEPPLDALAESVPDIGHRAVLVVARMHAGERYKGHDQLLEAWPMVRSRLPDARLVLVGAGDDVSRLRAKATSLDVADQVVFTGFVSAAAKRALYERAALFAMPSRDEGFGLVYLEAMAHGLACVGSVHDAAGDVIEDGVTGLLVDQSRTDLLAERLIGLLGDDARRRQMGQRGRARAEREFGYGRFRDRLVTLLEGAFEPRARATV